MAEPRENDVFRWHWKLGRAPIVGCYAHLAVFLNGGLRDTFWYDWPTRSYIDLDRVDLTLLGNIDDCVEIKRWDVPYYDPADIIDMSHSNNSRAPIYLKKSATKSQEWMLSVAENKFAEAQRAKESAERDIARLQDVLKQIRAGDLTEVSL
jgi:hypothetical protein